MIMKYRRVIICMVAIMIVVVIYSSTAQSPGAPPYGKPAGPFEKIAELEASVISLQQQVATLTLYCSNLTDYCLDDAYQRKRDGGDIITLYQRLLDEGRMTVVTNPDGTTILIADWLPTISAAISDIDDDIAAMELH